LTNLEIYFFDDITTHDESYDNIFFFKYEKGPDKLLYKRYPLIHLREIQRRRFLQRKTGLEFFLVDNRSVFLNF